MVIVPLALHLLTLRIKLIKLSNHSEKACHNTKISQGHIVFLTSIVHKYSTPFPPPPEKLQASDSSRGGRNGIARRHNVRNFSGRYLFFMIINLYFQDLNTLYTCALLGVHIQTDRKERLTTYTHYTVLCICSVCCVMCWGQLCML